MLYCPVYALNDVTRNDVTDYSRPRTCQSPPPISILDIRSLYTLWVKTRSSAIAVRADCTACSILTLFIVTATSRPLNKKSVCCQSANPINNYCGSASANPQSAHLSARALQSARPWWAVAPNGTVSSVMLTSRLAALETPLLCIGSQVAVRFFVVHFVAKRYILQQKCQKWE